MLISAQQAELSSGRFTAGPTVSKEERDVHSEE